MKLFLTTLVLGCAALSYRPALQSKVTVSNDLPTEVLAINPPALTCAGLPFSTAPSAKAKPAPPKKPRKLNVDETLKLIHASAEKHNVPAAFVRSIVEAESNYNSEAVSKAGAIGLMQLMPETAEEFGCDPKIPEQNVEAGTRYLKVLMDRYKKHRDPLKHVIAAYNAGPGNVDRYKGVPPFRETRTYVKRVIANIREIGDIPKKAPVTLASIMAD
jgi:soluble lytic murein transglycosylase-like protein